jgi:two-component system, NtrC family, sensor kinase
MLLPLHIKTALFASVLILLVMAATLVLFGSQVTQRLQAEQKHFAEAQAESLAAKIADVIPSGDYNQAARLVGIFNEARIGKDERDEIRVWEISGESFVQRIASVDGSPPKEIAAETKNALLSGQKTIIEESDANILIYRVFAPVISQNRAVGAVEVVEQLDTFPLLARRYLKNVTWLAAALVAVSALVIYALIRFFVYRPLSRVRSAIRRAKTGELTARAAILSRDEFGELGTELNRMLAEIEEFTRERERQNEILEEKVKTATAELKRRNEQLEHANLEIWQAARRLSELERLAAAGQTAAQFAHEVGTPLNLISGHVQLLRLGEGGETEKMRLDIIGAQIERIEGIVRSMLDRTRFGEVKLAPLDVNEILRGVAEIIAPNLEAENVRLALSLSENLPKIDGSGERLQQVFLNLVNNATDAMPAGGKLKIKTSEGENKTVVVEISDSGAGMDEETKKRIFEPLFTTKQRGRGTGLGLVVVRRILLEHRARIEVESEKGKGSCFRLHFPAAS